MDRKEVTIKEHGCHQMGGDTMHDHDHEEACMITLLRMQDGMIKLLDCMVMPKWEKQYTYLAQDRR